MTLTQVPSRWKRTPHVPIKDEDKMVDDRDQADKFVVVDNDSRSSTPRSKISSNTSFSSSSGDGLTIDLVPLPTRDGVLVSIQPPTVPVSVKVEGDDAGQDATTNLQRVPVDIVLVIDVSWSMYDAAPLPDVQDQSEREAGGLCILDLTKHAARTILQTLNEGDRLGIVTFAADAKIIQPLTYMTKYQKSKANTNINSLTFHGYTNLWAGIRAGLKLFEDDVTDQAPRSNAENHEETHNTSKRRNSVKGVYVLTDGQPNHMCPPQGYVNKLRPILASMSGYVPTIHTFGFGYDIRSELLQSIAETGNGSYAFIPDAGMIGTVFVHAVANLYATFAVDASIEIEMSGRRKPSLECNMGLVCDKTDDGGFSCALGNLQYGQSRDIVFDFNRLSNTEREAAITIWLTYKSPSGQEIRTAVTIDLNTVSDFAQELIEYHMLRRDLCAFLSSLFPLGSNNEHKPSRYNTSTTAARLKVDSLAKRIQGSPRYNTYLNIYSLYQDLLGDDAAGQVSEALTNQPGQLYWNRWGRHYLPSLLHAHMRQMCNSFKDPGPLRYGANSPLFIKCRDELDNAFDELPPPKPSRKVYSHDGKVMAARTVHMSRYNHSGNPCFEGSCSVRLGDDTKIPIRLLKSGTEVWTPLGPRTVVAILKTIISSKSPQLLCRVGDDLWITPWHPVKHQGQWVFPAQIAEATKMCGNGTSIYSVLLVPSSNPAAHAIEVGGQTCVTLGHGIVPSRVGTQNNKILENDARIHPFFGDYIAVAKSLSLLRKDAQGHVLSHGLLRDAESGLACGFRSLRNRSSLTRSVSRHRQNDKLVPRRGTRRVFFGSPIKNAASVGRV